METCFLTAVFLTNRSYEFVCNVAKNSIYNTHIVIKISALHVPYYECSMSMLAICDGSNACNVLKT